MLTTPITTKRARNLIWNFHNRKTTKQTVAVTFSLEELRHYIEVCLLEGDDEMRVYLGQYSKKNNKPIKEPDYDGRQTLIFVPLKGGEENIPKTKFVNPLNEGELCPPRTGCSRAGTLYTETQKTDFPSDEYDDV